MAEVMPCDMQQLLKLTVRLDAEQETRSRDMAALQAALADALEELTYISSLTYEANLAQPWCSFDDEAVPPGEACQPPAMTARRRVPARDCFRAGRMEHHSLESQPAFKSSLRPVRSYVAPLRARPAVGLPPQGRRVGAPPQFFGRRVPSSSHTFPSQCGSFVPVLPCLAESVQTASRRHSFCKPVVTSTNQRASHVSRMPLGARSCRSPLPAVRMSHLPFISSGRESLSMGSTGSTPPSPHRHHT